MEGFKQCSSSPLLEFLRLWGTWKRFLARVNDIGSDGSSGTKFCMEKTPEVCVKQQLVLKRNASIMYTAEKLPSCQCEWCVFGENWW